MSHILQPLRPLLHRLKALLCLVLALAGPLVWSTVSTASAQTVNVCFAAGEEHDPNAFSNTNTRAKLTNPAYFGPSGTVAPETINFISLSTISSSSLTTNNCEVFYGGGGNPGISSFAASTVLTWLAGGSGRFVLSGCDYWNASYICNLKRTLVDIVNGGVSIDGSLSYNPILCGGALTVGTFGGISSYQIPQSGDVVMATHVAFGSPSAALTDSLTTPTFLFTADADMFGSSGSAAIGTGPTATTDQAKFILNSFKFAIDAVKGRQINVTTCSSTYESSPGLGLAKTSQITTDGGNIGFANIGDVITYTYLVTNTGNVTINNVSVSDSHSGAGTLSAITLFSTTGTNNSNNTANLPAGATATFKSTYTVVVGDAAAGSITNTASANGSPASGTLTPPTSGVSVAFAKDYGDAPDTAASTGSGNYQTTASDGGPSHSIVSGLALGTNNDADSGTLQNTAADADDTNQTPDDEDAVASFPTLTTASGATYTVPVSVTNTTGSPAYLVGYIDFNKDGDFADTGEKATTATVNASGSQNVSFTTPTGMTTGTTYARFRLSNTQSQAESSIGASTSGEVEDYSLSIVTPSLTPFTCSATLYQVRANSGSEVLTINRSTNPWTLSSPLTTFAFAVRALGYNPVDNFLYALNAQDSSVVPVVPATTTLYRIDSTGAVQAIPLTGAHANFSINAFTVHSSGTAYAWDAWNKQLYTINLSTGAVGAAIGAATTHNLGDIAFNPVDNQIYGVDNSVTPTQLVRINPSTGAITVIGSSGVAGSAFGSIYIDGNGTVYGYNNPGGFYIFSTNTGAATLASTSPSVGGSDGASCIAFSSTLPLDYGDAPDTGSGSTTSTGNYLTKDSRGGPSHLVVAGLRLGSNIDSENGSLQNTAADADDTNQSPDDEDAVASFPTLTTASGQTYTVAVDVTNTTGSPAYLVGYIDFNRDGDFLDTGEKSATITANASGSQNVSFTTPAGMTTGTTYARFRLSSTQTQAESSVGVANSGEVEDYALSMVPQPFICTPNIYMIQGTAVSNGLYEILITAGSVSISPIIGSLNPPVNAIGFREADGYIYALNTTSNHLIRIAADGSQTDLGAVAGLPAGSYNSGDFGPDGYYYVLNGTGGTLQKIDVSTVSRVGTGGTAPDNVPDIAIHPSDGYAYGVLDLGRAIRIPLAGGAGTQFGPIHNRSFGSAYTDAAGNIYLSDNATNDIFLLNKTTGAISKVADSNPNVSVFTNDGAFCKSASFPTPPTDYADAPDTATGTGVGNYSTTLSDSGPSHLIVSGLSLGTEVDADDGALQNPTADADDTDQTPDDEDGIASFPALAVTAGQTYTVSVSVTNTTGSPAYLVGYIDFNKDGDFLDTGEKATNVTVNASGSYNVSWTTPAGMTVGNTYARFRLSSTQAQAASSVGASTSGEVEDYTLTIVPVYSLSGRVFEDINYGGGSGRSFATAAGVGRPGVRVELYDSAGAYVGFAFTNASGNYTFNNLLAGDYTVRAVNSFVTSSRTGGCTPSADGIAMAACTQLAVQTFRTNGLTSNVGTADTERVGGENSSLVDAAANTTSATLASLTAATTTAQSITPISLSANSTGIDFGYNFDTIVSVRDSGQGSLRQFITNSNALGNEVGLNQSGRTPGREVSILMLPNGTSYPGMTAAMGNVFSAGVATVNVLSALPNVIGIKTDIDASTQIGSSCPTPILELNGASAGAAANGLSINRQDHYIRGLIINRFGSNGIVLARDISPNTSDNTHIECNYIGTNAAGTAAAPNGASGISMQGDNSFVGSGTAAGRNVISGNTAEGILVVGGGSLDNQIVGNYIGTDASGTQPLGNGTHGIHYYNTSGTNAGNSLVSQNAIAFNTQTGVGISWTTPAATGIRITQNSIFNNGQLGIDLSSTVGGVVPQGITNNDLGDGDSASGPNALQNYPVFTGATLIGGNLTVYGRLNSKISTNYTIEVFSNQVCNPNQLGVGVASSNGEGERYHSSVSVTTDGSGNATFSLTIPQASLAGNIITATATVASGTEINNTSEFSQCFLPLYDYGDAPDTGAGTGAGNYQTTNSDDGARHAVIAGLRLGSNLDSDTGTLQNAAADVDDTTGTPDDEESVSSFPILTTVSGQTYTVAVSVSNTTGSDAYLVGYIDFNKDGDFLDTGEQSATITVSASGSQNVSFTTPTGMTVGTTYARFRLSSTQAHAESSVGAASNGEVEDYKLEIIGFTVSGSVYADLQPNGVLNPDENWSAGTAVYVNLVQGGSVVQSVLVNPGTGAYSFSAVVPGSYTVVVTNSATATGAVAPTGWLFADPSGGSLSLSVNSNLTNQDFGLFHGSKVSGRVFYDDGLSSGTANDAVQNGGELGVSDVVVGLSDGSNSLTTSTNTSGDYSFYVPYTYGSSITVSHDLLPASGTNIGGSSVVPATDYNDPVAQEHTISFSSGQVYGGYNLGLVRPSAFKPDQQGQTTSPGTLTYAHLYQPGTMGTVNFAESGGDFTYEIRLDANCNGSFDTGETWQTAPSMTVDATWPRNSDGSFKICAVEVRVSVPAGVPANTVDIAQIASALMWTNNPDVTDPKYLTNTTTVLEGGVLQLTKEVRNITQGGGFVASTQAKPGDILEYRIHYKNIGSKPLFEVELLDPVPAYSDLEQNAYPGSTEIQLSCPDGSTVNLEMGAVGDIQIDLAAQCTLSTASHPNGSGTAEALLPGEGGYFLYRVKVR